MKRSNVTIIRWFLGHYFALHIDVMRAPYDTTIRAFFSTSLSDNGYTLINIRY